MKAKDIMVYDLNVVSPKDQVETVLMWMEESKLSHLALVEKGELQALIFEEDLLAADPDSKIKDLKTVRPIAFVRESQHYYDVIKLLAETGLSMVPVLNEEKKYMGAISLKEVIKALGSTATMSEAGAVIVLEVRQRDYSLLQIANIVEGNDCKILSSYISSYKESEMMDVTLKLNKSVIDGVLQTFNRYSYTVKESFQESNYQEVLQRRYDELMNYIKM